MDKESPFSIAVVHSNAPHLAHQVLSKIRDCLNVEVAMLQKRIARPGAHAGPGAVAVAILKHPDHSVS
jgi:hypothetical protein